MFSQGDVKDGSSKMLVEATNHVGDDWMLESGYTYHIFLNKSQFKGFKKMEEVVLLDGMKSFQILGLRDISLEMFDDIKVDLHEVRHVPEVHRNLISLSGFDVYDYAIMISKSSINVNKGTMTLLE